MRVKSDEEFHRIRIILKGGKKIKIKKYEKVNQNACKKRHKRVKYTELKNGKGTYVNKKIGVSPSGKATDSDSVIREFKSLHPSQK